MISHRHSLSLQASFTDVTLRPCDDGDNEMGSSLTIVVCDPEKYTTFLETYLRYRVKTQVRIHLWAVEKRSLTFLGS